MSKVTLESLAEGQKQLATTLESLAKQMNQRFDEVGQRLDKVETGLHLLKEEVEGLERWLKSESLSIIDNNKNISELRRREGTQSAIETRVAG